ncbi:MAG: hypothetical protein IJK29_11870, partial [Bacteroidales bacterium]|nr:hypothetical protein [Bacteroidales bacterium]
APGPFGTAFSLYADGQSNLDKELYNTIAFLYGSAPEGFQRAIGKPFGAPAGAFPFQRNDLPK